jgi:hypothetical protein
MYGLTRATITLIAGGAAGLLIWLATQVNGDTVGGFWAVYGLIAGAGLVMALSQLLGGWTKWGWPRLAITFLLTAFLPIAFVSMWVVLAAEPGNGWFHRHVLSWSSDIHVLGLVNDLKEYVSVFAFGIGLVFGYSFDTAGPVVRRDAVVDRRADTVPTEGRGGGLLRRRRPVTTTTDGRAADEPLTADRETTTRSRDRERVS